MKEESTVSGDEFSAKVHVIAFYKGAGVSLSVHHREIRLVGLSGLHTLLALT